MNFFLRSDLSKFQATVILHTIIFMKNEPHHENQHEKLNNVYMKISQIDGPLETPSLLRMIFPDIHL